MKIRAKKVARDCIGLLIVGFAYFLICNKIGFGLPCLFHFVTGLQCPGCGISRVCISILKGDLQSAWMYNRGALLIAPFLMYLFIRVVYMYIRYDDIQLKKWEKVVTTVITVAFMLYGVLRNIYGW